MFQKHQIQIRASQVHQQKKNINWINERFRKQLKRKSKKKKWKEAKKNKKLEHQEQKFQEKLLEIMEYQDKMFNQTMCKT